MAGLTSVLYWIAVGLGCLCTVAAMLVGFLTIAAVLMAGQCDAVELRRGREIEADEEAGVDVEA